VRQREGVILHSAELLGNPMSKAIPRAVDYFPFMAADILVRLYTHFPTSVDLNATHLDLEKIDPDEDFERLAGIWADTAQWLQEAGYIRVRIEKQKNTQLNLDSVVLTEKGIDKLTRQATAASNQNMGDCLVAIVRDVDSEASKEKLLKYIQQLFELPIK
jgi:hypothetical protein